MAAGVALAKSRVKRGRSPQQGAKAPSTTLKSALNNFSTKKCPDTSAGAITKSNFLRSFAVNYYVPYAYEVFQLTQKSYLIDELKCTYVASISPTTRFNVRIAGIYRQKERGEKFKSQNVKCKSQKSGYELLTFTFYILTFKLLIRLRLHPTGCRVRLERRLHLWYWMLLSN